MYELVQVSESCYYMDCPSKVGFYLAGDDAFLIDSGSDKDAAKKVKKILDARNWRLKAVLNTHAHADHTGGNQYLQSQTGCRIYASGAEHAIAEHPVLEPVMLYGGSVTPDMQTKFLMAGASSAEELTDDILPDGLEKIALPGHSYDMTGFRSRDGVVFLADCLCSAATIEKYRVGFIYDVGAYLGTLERVSAMEAVLFVPSHAEPAADIAPLAKLNIDNTLSVAATIRELLSSPRTFEDLLAELFGVYGLSMNLTQHLLVGSTVKSYLSYLKLREEIGCSFRDNRMVWQTV